MTNAELTALKAEYPRHILLNLRGDFYEAYGDDARLVASAIGLVLSSTKKGDGLPLTGFPRHQKDAYLPAIIAKCGPVAVREPFELENHPPRKAPARFHSEPQRQRTLIDGLDCLPGQQDLF